MNERQRSLGAGRRVCFVYVLGIRTYDVADTFLMLGEQTRDWTIALGGITDLPLTGAPSTAGGRGFGPVYYWLLWIGRVTIGPFMDNLPHAGGITVALLQSIADIWLFVALSRRMHWALALAMCLLIASAPFDIAISSVIWNPPVAAALIKMATAMALIADAGVTALARRRRRRCSPGWRCSATCRRYSSPAPLLAALAIREFSDRSNGSSNVRSTIDRTCRPIIAGRDPRPADSFPHRGASRAVGAGRADVGDRGR